MPKSEKSGSRAEGEGQGGVGCRSHFDIFQSPTNRSGFLGLKRLVPKLFGECFSDPATSDFGPPEILGGTVCPALDILDVHIALVIAVACEFAALVSPRMLHC